jgi:hypothetical protein
VNGNLEPQNKILIYLGKQHYYSDVQCMILRQVRLLKFFGINNMGQASKNFLHLNLSKQVKLLSKWLKKKKNLKD